MGNQRRYYPRQYEMGKRPAVGGFVQHTSSRAHVPRREIIHYRPDEVGRHVEIDDESFSGLTMADFGKVRDVLALQMAQVTPDLYRWSGVQEVG